MKATALKKYTLPNSPGVYFFRRGSKLLYVGKATSLKQRVASYFSSDLITSRGDRIVTMIQKATTVNYEKTDSVLEALILEANYIKKYQPPYNAKEKDNKSYNYVVITKEEFPRVLIVRGRELFAPGFDLSRAHTFGPYTEGKSLREALKIIRKIFPYRDTCTPSVGKPCFNAQIGLCPGVCSGLCTAQMYKETIKNIVLLLNGKRRALLSGLKISMKKASKQEHFELASTYKRQVMALTHIRDTSLIQNEHSLNSDGGYVRIESYDISHTAGKQVVGALVSFVNGLPNKSGYRKFILKNQKNSDIENLCEILTRRFSHTEWMSPDLLVIDGGETHRSAITAHLESISIRIPVVSVEKDVHHKGVRIYSDSELAKSLEKVIFAINAETHRFAITFHRKKRAESFLHT